MADLTGKVAIVTGGASGIGLAIVQTFLREEASVLIADVDNEAGQDRVRELQAEGRRVEFMHADVSLESDVEAMVGHAVQSFGRLDCLVNNAGIWPARIVPITDLSLDDWERIMAVNARSVFLGTKYAVRAMLAGGGGSIVNNASILGMAGGRNAISYAASKGAVVQLTRSVALAYATSNIRVNCMAPGYIDTPMVQNEEGVTNRMAGVLQPMGRLGTPQEVAELALFLASDRSSFMTGAIVPVDGGYLAR